VLFGGLALSLVSIEKLFNIDIDGIYYLRLFILLQGVFCTWFFLSKMPDDFAALDVSEEYPIGLKLFSQYVLLPLVSIYLSILYLYEVKILTKFSLPVGWVSNLIIAFSIVGILCFLLLYPFGKKENNAWIGKFSRLFYYLLLPLLLLLFIAIGYRIQQYGFTENRYFVLLTGIWLFGISIYFIWSKKDNIAIIPISLSILTFLSSIGYIGAFSVGMKSQANRLVDLFARNQIEAENTPEDRAIYRKDAVQINGIIDYFAERDEIARLYPFFKITEKDSVENLSKYDIKPKLLAKIAVPSVSGYYYYADEEEKDKTENEIISYKNPFPNEKEDFFYNNVDIDIFDTRGYDFMITAVDKPNNDSLQFRYDNFTLNVYSQDTNRVYLVHKNDIQTIDLTYFIKNATAYKNKKTPTGETGEIPPHVWEHRFATANYNAKIIVKQLEARVKNDNDIEVRTYNFALLIKKR
jgi:Domain of unknown function (DUF4153)